MRVTISKITAKRSMKDCKATTSNRTQTLRCRHPSYELKSMPVPNTSRKFQQLVCTKCGLVAGALDLRVDVQLDKIANALARLIEKFGV